MYFLFHKEVIVEIPVKVVAENAEDLKVEETVVEAPVAEEAPAVEEPEVETEAPAEEA